MPSDGSDRPAVAILLGAAAAAVGLAGAHLGAAWWPWPRGLLSVVPATGTLVGQLLVAASVWAGATALFARQPGIARIGLGRAARWYAWITLGTVAFLYPAVRALFTP